MRRLDFDPLWRTYNWARPLPAATYRQAADSGNHADTHAKTCVNSGCLCVQSQSV